MLVVIRDFAVLHRSQSGGNKLIDSVIERGPVLALALSVIMFTLTMVLAFAPNTIIDMSSTKAFAVSPVRSASNLPVASNIAPIASNTDCSDC